MVFGFSSLTLVVLGEWEINSIMITLLLNVHPFSFTWSVFNHLSNRNLCTSVIVIFAIDRMILKLFIQME